MRQTSLENFIRSGGNGTFILKTGPNLELHVKQAAATADLVRNWVDAVWSRTFGATSQAILKTEPFEFSPSGLSDIDQEALRSEATEVVRDAMGREGIDLTSSAWEERAVAVLVGFVNQAQQEAMGIEFYVWQTQSDARVREGHAERDDKIFRWDVPPEGGHPSQDLGCRCYARPLGKEGYWERVSEGVETFAADVDALEGTIDHMYLDTNGNVTVGQGKLLSSADDAADLPFQVRTTGTLASTADIRNEFETIHAMQDAVGREADYFAAFTHLNLSQDTIERLVVEHIRDNFEGLLSIFPDFGNFPVAAQVAIWDMVYNLGLGGFRREFPNLQEAIRAGDWAIAASESARTDVGPERNDYVFDLFMEAADAP